MMTGLELLRCDQMAAADQATIASGVPGRLLMARAGRAVAEAALRHAAPGIAWVLCGPGNNGGDGYVAATHLRQFGFDVRVFALEQTPPSRDRSDREEALENNSVDIAADRKRSEEALGAAKASQGDAAWARDQWRAQGAGPIAAMADLAAAPEPGIIIDALFGAGLTRPIAGPAADALACAAAQDAPVIAVDIPSGVCGDTGRVRGTAIAARETVTFCRLKPGHLLLPGRAQCGQITCVDIGISDATVTEVADSLWQNAPALWRDLLPRRRLDGHKYTAGHVLVLGGGMLTGAGRLAALAAARIGAGLVTVAAPAASRDRYAAAAHALMVRPCDSGEDYAALLADTRRNALLLGPGGGDGLPDYVRLALATGRATVLDADALTQFSDNSDALFAALHPDSVLTPHAGEFQRLFGSEVAAQDKLATTRMAADKAQAVVVQKGADTVIAAPDGRAVITANAPPQLATAGSGDVLAGAICGLLAQGMPSFEAACAAVWLHGDAAQRLGPRIIADDLPVAMAAALGSLIDSAGGSVHP